jgi:osmotically-inducible protein OsmY
MMNMENSFKAVFASMMIVSGLAACDKPGPAESAGKKIDQATENVSASVSNSAEKAGNTIAESSRSTGQAIDDSEITAKIKALLLNEPGLKSLKISVNTEKGEVTLTGKADTQSNSAKATKIAESVTGVNSVKNQLSVSK